MLFCFFLNLEGYSMIQTIYWKFLEIFELKSFDLVDWHLSSFVSYLSVMNLFFLLCIFKVVIWFVPLKWWIICICIFSVWTLRMVRKTRFVFVLSNLCCWICHTIPVLINKLYTKCGVRLTFFGMRITAP